MIGDLFNLLLLQPSINLIVVILRVLEGLNVPGSLGFSIIILTAAIRFLIWPLMNVQLRSAKKLQDLKPHMDELKKKHGTDKQALSQAQLALYKEKGVNPAGGCLPAILQILLIYPLYQVIGAFLEGAKGLERINYFLYDKSWQLQVLPDVHFFGLNLAAKPQEFGKYGLIILLVPIITGLFQFVLAKMMAPKAVKLYPTDSTKEKKEKESTEEAMTAMQGQMTYLMPIMIGYFAFTFPIGLALYWNTLNLISVWQQYLITGWGEMESLIKRLGLKR